MDSLNGSSSSSSSKSQQLKTSCGSVSPVELAAQNFVIGVAMDSLNGSSSSSSTKSQQLKPSRGSVSPVERAAQNFVIGGQYPQQYHHSNFPILDPYASPESQSGSPSLNSPFVNLLRWSSGRSSSGSNGGWGSGSGSSGNGGGGHLSPMPLTSIENFEMPFSRSPAVFKTPVKIEEDVLVMDGIVVNSEKSRKSKGSAGQRTRSPLSSIGGRLPFSPFSSSSSLSSGKENRCSYKMEKCRSWDDFRTCRFGSMCQFAHGVEEQQVKNYSENYKSEEPISKPASSRSCTDGNKPQTDLHKAKGSTSTSLIGQFQAANVESVKVGYVSPIEPQIKPEIEPKKNYNWCPLDDGIQFSLPSAPTDLNPSRAAVDSYIDSVLYGFSARKRLSAFTEFYRYVG